MDFKQIETFIAVAKYKNFSKAANAIFLSQPSVSSQISALEKELNVELFYRTSKEVTLTCFGESFLQYAINILNTRNTALSHLSSLNSSISGRFTLEASSTPCNSIIPLLVEEFYSRYPELSFNIIEKPSGEIINDILKFNCEIGIIGNFIKDDKIHCNKLTEDELVLISSPSINIPDNVTINELVNYKFIFREKNSATRKNFQEALIESGITLDKLIINCEVNSLDTLLQLVKRGVGVSVLSKKACEDYVNSKSIKLSNIENLNLKRNIYLITSSKRTLTPIAKAFFHLCKDKFKF